MSKKLSVKVVVLALIFSLVMPFSAFGTVEELVHDSTTPGVSLAGKYPAYDDIDFQYSITEERVGEDAHKITIETGKAEADLKAAVEAGSISFSLDRDAEREYLDPELYPFPSDFGALENWKDKEGNEVIQVKGIEVDGSKLVVTVETYGTEYYYSGDPEALANGVGKIYSIDHTNGGKWLDKCGYYDFVAAIGEEAIGSVHAKVVPYDSYRTPYELFDELEALKDYDGDKYVEVGSVGHSSVDNYDTPYVIIASEESDVTDWLAYTELSETNPTQVLADIKAGKYDDMAVPLYVSNCHTNENPGINGQMEFIELILNSDTITLKTLKDYTEAGRAQLEYEKSEVFKTGLSEIYGEYATELGRLRGENGDIVDYENWVTYGYSSRVDFDKYYEMNVEEVVVDELLEDVFFICVPTMNMEGYMQSTRATGVGFDPNRDYANQTMYEDANAMAFMAKWNPMVYTEIHGRVEGLLIEPCGAPHNPNIEYDLIVEKFIELGEALGNACVANNDRFNSYELPARDYIEFDENSLNENNKVQWGSPWDDLSTNFGSQFPVFYGTCGITWEQPAYDDIDSEQVIPYGLLGQGRYVQDNKIDLLTSQAELYERGLNNENSNDKVAKYYVDQYDRPYAQADIMRPVYDGEGENGNFYPEAFIIPMDKENQKNIQDAAEAVKWIARNDMKYKIAGEAFEYDGVEYPEGTVIASMYQAKRSLLHANFGPGTFVTVWKGLYSEAFSQFPYSRGFDIITVAEPAAYEAIDAVCVDGPDYAGTLELLTGYAAQFSGVEGADVIISNASEDSAAAVNALLAEGKTVAMITDGEYMGDFICSYEDFVEVVADAYIVAAEGVYGADIEAAVIAYSPVVYINGGNAPATYGNIELKGGNSYCFDAYALKQMGFETTEKATKADAIVGNGFNSRKANDAVAQQAVLDGTPYMVWGSGSSLSGIVDGVAKSGPEHGTDMLAYVTYPEITLINANYEADGDYLNYQYGTMYFTDIPEGAKVLVQNAGEKPFVGCVGIFDEALQAEFDEYNNGVVAFEYQEDGMDIVAFANSLVHKGHPQDEFKYIANFLFSRSLADEAYVGVEEPADTPDEPTVEPDEPTDEPADEPTDEPADEPADKPADEDADAEGADTGDNANILAWLALAVVAAAGTVVYKRKRQ